MLQSWRNTTKRISKKTYFLNAKIDIKYHFWMPNTQILLKAIFLDDCVRQKNFKKIHFYFVALSFGLKDSNPDKIRVCNPDYQPSTKIARTRATWLRSECFTCCSNPVHAPQSRTQDSDALSRTQKGAMFAEGRSLVYNPRTNEILV